MFFLNNLSSPISHVSPLPLVLCASTSIFVFLCYWVYFQISGKLILHSFPWIFPIHLVSTCWFNKFFQHKLCLVNTRDLGLVFSSWFSKLNLVLGFSLKVGGNGFYFLEKKKRISWKKCYCLKVSAINSI